MYCGQCGKKVMENMLFCPFCGSPIVIPEQDEAPAAASVPREPAEEKAAAEEVRPVQARPLSLFDSFDFPEEDVEEQEESAEEEPFVPLSFDFDDDSASQAQEAAPGDGFAAVTPEFVEADEPAEEIRPARRNVPETLRPERNQRRSGNTYIPVREIDPDDMFMDDLDDEDEYDEYDGDDYDMDDAPSRRRYRDEEDEFDFEEPEYGGFFQRHIRGIVGLILMLILALICVIWAMSPKGQLVLARVNLAWKAQPYADLGYEAYHQDSDLLAARYYEKALTREADNYEYAHSAMVAYYEAEDIESAAAMLKKCIELAPDNSEPYLEMLVLYPDAATRPWEIRELVRLGYQRTGNEALKID